MKNLVKALTVVTAISATYVSAEPESRQQSLYDDCIDECMDSGLGDGTECPSQCADEEGS